MKLHVSIVGLHGRDGAAAQYDVEGPEGLRGRDLAGALRTVVRQELFANGAPLADLATLPVGGHLLLTPFPRTHVSAGGHVPVWLAVSEGPDAGQTVPLPRGAYSLGRGSCDIRILDPSVARHHADLVIDAASITLYCTEGNHAVEFGRRVRSLRLTEGDRFTLGRTIFLLTAGGAAGHPPESWPVVPPTVDRPSSSGRPWLMLLGAILPLVVGIGLAAATGSWYFLAFSGLGLFTGGIPAIAELRARRLYARQVRDAASLYLSQLERAAPPLGDRAVAAFPPANGTAGAVASDAAFGLRLGRGEVVPPIASGPGGEPHKSDPEDGAPVVLDVRPGNLCSITGSATASAGVIRAIIGQAALNAAAGGWEVWLQSPCPALPSELRRVPGIRVLTSPEQLLSLRRERSGAAIIVLTSPDPAWLEASTSPVEGFLLPAVVCIGPWTVGPTVTWRLDVGEGLLSEKSGNRRVFPDRVGFETLAALAGRIADAQTHQSSPPTSNTSPADLPSAISFSLPHEPWESTSATELSTFLGVCDSGDVVFDLVKDGPHALIAGTTGAGKSELVKALTLGLACTYAPSELALMLVDFKGGATLGEFRGLPHCHAFVSDLHLETAERTLESLRTEIARRERILGGAAATDYAHYRTMAAPVAARLPRLVVVVDEFRVLTDELPDALAELMRIAAVGRSLGVHLVLATQRPQGVVSAEMRANINAVICLRLMSSFDSSDLLGTTAAAKISADLPGRAYLRRGGGAPLLFHAVSVVQKEPGWSVTPVGEALGLHGPPIHIEAAGVGPATPVDIVRGIEAYSLLQEWPAQLFSAPLPDRLARLPRRVRTECPPSAVVLGLLDDIGRQRHEPFAWNPTEHRRLAVVSGPSGGAHSAVETLVAGAARADGECHVYVADGTGSLSAAASVPRVGGYVGPDEPERANELLDLLAQTTIGESMTRLLVVTGLAAWQSAMGGAAFAHFDDRLAALAREAASRSLSIVVAGDRDLTSSRFFALAEHRLYCPFGLGPETVLGWPRLRQVRPVPGRAVLVGPDLRPPGMALQLLAPDASPFAMHFPQPGSAILRSTPLPSRLSPVVLAAKSGTPRPTSIRHGLLMGVTGPDNRPWTWTPGSVGLVLGRPGSGKTTTLLHVAARAAGVKVALGFAEGESPEGAMASSADWADESSPPPLVIIDDATDLPESDKRQIEEWHSRGSRVLMGAAPSSRLFTALPLAALAREPESALLLNPRSAADADFLGWRIQPLARDIPGRGLAIIDGSPRAVHCAEFRVPSIPNQRTAQGALPRGKANQDRQEKRPTRQQEDR